MIRLPPRSTRTDTPFPDTTLFRSIATAANAPRIGLLAPTRRPPLSAAPRTVSIVRSWQSLPPLIVSSELTATLSMLRGADWESSVGRWRQEAERPGPVEPTLLERFL